MEGKESFHRIIIGNNDYLKNVPQKKRLEVFAESVIIKDDYAMIKPNLENLYAVDARGILQIL